MSAGATPLLAADGLTKVFRTQGHGSWFRRKHGALRAVWDVSFVLNRGEVLGIVGESGSGKTTVARMILRLVEPSSGTVLLRGRDVMAMTPLEVRAHIRPAVRMIFQDPDAALNPAYTIGFGLARAIRMHAKEQEHDVSGTVATLLQRVDLDESFAAKYPDELSGGEKRRVGICRALATDPAIIVADEPLSGLDVVLQERILELLKSEQEKRQFALILVSHDLDRVNQVCDRVLVMHGGRVVEQTTLRRNTGPIREQYRHPYSVLLQQARIDVGVSHAAVQAADTGGRSDQNGTSRPNDAGCTFARSCPRRVAMDDPAICWELVPPLIATATGQAVACHFSEPDVKAAVGLSPGVELLVSN